MKVRTLSFHSLYVANKNTATLLRVDVLVDPGGF